MKKSVRSSARQSSSTKSARKTRSSAKSSAGTYTVPRGHVSMSVPPFWSLRQTNDDIELEGPSGSTSVIITAFQRNRGNAALDAREYLTHYLETAPRNGRLSVGKGTRLKAGARYKDQEGDNWEVSFVTNGDTLLLATCNSSFPWTNKELKTALSVIDSLRLLKK